MEGKPFQTEEARADNVVEKIQALTLTLFSYRINFQVNPVDDLAEGLMDGYIRYIFDVDASRTVVQTYRPAKADGPNIPEGDFGMDKMSTQADT